MRVLHIGLLSHYTDGMLYQDNCLAEMNVKDGHEVIYITDSRKYADGKLIDTEEEDTVLPNGIRLIRLKYDFLFCNFLTEKIQKVSKLYDLIQEIKPDTILYHGAFGYELMTVANYKREHPEMLFYVDSHADFNNTAKNIVSKIAYKYLHGFFVSKARSMVNKFLYISEECRSFLREMYGLQEKEMDNFPLGGFIVDKDFKLTMKERLIDNLNLPKDAVIFAHSGKLDYMKKTKDLLEAFKEVDDKRFVMIVFGSIPEEQSKVLNPLIDNDDRVHFVGWKNGKECIDILSGVDMYCQPGSQSATAQVAACCGCALMLYPHNAYRSLYKDVVLYAKDSNEIKKIFINISKKTTDVFNMERKIYIFARRTLSYDVFSKRYLKK